MPIRPQFRCLYPLDWPQLSASIRFRRAKGRCEACGRPHGDTVKHLGDGEWWDAAGSAWRDGRGRALPRLKLRADDPPLPATRIVLATAHLDHDPTNNQARNLKALCQRCHMLNDRDEHRRQRWLTLRMRKAVGDLFFGAIRFVGREGKGLPFFPSIICDGERYCGDEIRAERFEALTA